MNFRLFKIALCLVLPVFLLTSRKGMAQAPVDAGDNLNSDIRTPTEVEDTFLQASGIHAHFEASNKTSDPANAMVRADQIISVPHFTSSFAFQGKTFPFTVVGQIPQTGQTARVPTQIVPISLYFEGYADEQGNPIILDVEPRIPAVLNSPNFHAASYLTGYTQFADAVQRAQFFRVMSPDWHTLLESPKVMRTVNIDVPRGSATLYRMRSSGAIFAVLDEGFFISQLNTILQFEDLQVSGLPIALTSNVFLAPKADIRRCCVLGFHTSFDAGESENLRLVQTFVWATWIDPGIFGSTVADVTALSHEISEWLNDPFSINVVPGWQFPNAVSGCQTNLETGDPMSAFPNAGYPVTIDGTTYHPQNETLLQWFQRKTPSDAFDRAYSFPDETLLTAAAQSCGAR
ncbi:MAG TPA: hypothetical protein VI636_04445 [Candidatus Angelobacter sp.]